MHPWVAGDAALTYPFERAFGGEMIRLRSKGVGRSSVALLAFLVSVSASLGQTTGVGAPNRAGQAPPAAAAKPSEAASQPAPLVSLPAPATGAEGAGNLEQPLEPFGYSYFAQAREAVEWRRQYLRMLQAAAVTGQWGPLLSTPPQRGLATQEAALGGTAGSQEQGAPSVQLNPPQQGMVTPGRIREEPAPPPLLRTPSATRPRSAVAAPSGTESAQGKSVQPAQGWPTSLSPQQPAATESAQQLWGIQPGSTATRQQPTPGAEGSTSAATAVQPQGGQLLQPSAPWAAVGPSVGAPATQGAQPYPLATTPPGLMPLPSVDALRSFVGPDAMLYMNVVSPAPERYQLGPGDQLTLRYWSNTLEPAEVTLKVDERGYVALPLGGRLVARGQTLGELEASVRQAMSRVLRDVQVSLSLKELRTMGVLVTGEAYAPGSYQMPATVTLYNALYACGGPNLNGSLRRIQLKRSDGSTRSFDFYRFLLNGDGSQDVPLQPGDVIYIPLVDDRIAVKGEVQRPAIYEALPGERLRDVLRFAGGAKPTGVSQRVSVTTVQPGVARKLIDADLMQTDDANNPALHDGDTVEVMSIRPEAVNAVVLDGAVDQPGSYAVSPGMTVADLIEKARGTVPDAYLVRADLFRKNPDNTLKLIPIDLKRAIQREPDANVELQPRDRLVVYSMEDAQFTGYRQVEITGAVQRPNTYYRADGMRVQDLLLQAGGPLPEAFLDRAFLQRRNPDGTYGPMLTINLRKAMSGQEPDNAVLQDRDTLAVYTRQQASYTPDNVVEIKGAVQSPGFYPRAESMRLSDALQLAGGVTPNAADEVEIARARSEAGTPPLEVSLQKMATGGPDADPLLADGDVITVRTRSDFRMKPWTVTVSGAVSRPGPYAITSKSERLSDIIRRAGGLTSDAFPEGVQFFRDPKLLTTQVQQGLTPRIRELLQVVNDEAYRRALARSDIERARSVQSSTNAAQAAAALPTVGSLLTATGSTTPKAPVDMSALPGRDLVTPARPLTDDDLLPAGNVNVNLVGALRSPGGKDDITLREGDVIIVPERPTTVAVTGAVVVPSAVTYESGRPLSYYTERAGGLTPDAAEDRILLIRATGEVSVATRRSRVDLGDIIFVPTKVMSERLRDRQSEIDTIFRNITSGGIIYAVIRSLLK